MALVRNIARRPKERQQRHEETECFMSQFSDREGRYLQIETTGSQSRESKGKVNQVIQFDEQGASQLKQMIGETFPNLK